MPCSPAPIQIDTGSRWDSASLSGSVPAALFSGKKVRWIKRLVYGLAIAALLGVSASAQTQAAGSDPEALTLASKAIAALTGGQQISDVTLTGTVIRDVGTSDTGTVTLEALGTGESRADLTLSEGTRTEIRDASTGEPEGEWINPDGTTGTVALHNTFTDPVWFFPALGSLAGGSQVVLTFIGQETRNGATVLHLRSYSLGTVQSVTPNLQQLSTMDFYLDPVTFLPVAEAFNTHPDNNELVNLAVEIDFSGYRVIKGVEVPTRIQRLLQGHVAEDMTVTSASFNSGLSLAAFSVN